METISVALAAIRANVLRSLLTMLGIVIGVGAVITMVALGSGAKQAVEEQIQALGTDLLSVFAGQSFTFGVASGQRVSLTTEDSDALSADPSMFRNVVPEISGNYQVKFGNQNANLSIVATVPQYAEVNSYDITAGEMFSVGDNDSRRRVAVLGSDVPEQLGGNAAAMVGQQVMIRGLPFEIVGILSEKGSQGFFNPDENVLIPLRTGQFRVHGSDRLRSITVQVHDPTMMMAAMVDIEGVLRKEHGIRPGQPNDFRLRNRAEFLSTAQETTETFTFLLAGIAAVSLLVGGIGIMNIMLVSVTERTKEIGLRKAVGATRRSVLAQFLVEAVTLCLLGGVFGIVVGSAGAVALARLQGWNTLISPEAILVAFAFSAAVGIFFGLWPAQRAARLDPIEALRHE
ncbi:MAG: ABC transporter permease [Gemmatimonadota bacterium]